MSAVEFSVEVVDGEATRPLGRLHFAAAPHIGHFVTLADEREGPQAYEVVAVIHAPGPQAGAGSLLVRHFGAAADIGEQLRVRSFSLGAPR